MRPTVGCSTEPRWEFPPLLTRHSERGLASDGGKNLAFPPLPPCCSHHPSGKWEWESTSQIGVPTPTTPTAVVQ
jgi:hypothetical protein